jgi:organic hydroperoxide reductase OsmC/OhrA
MGDGERPTVRAVPWGAAGRGSDPFSRGQGSSILGQSWQISVTPIRFVSTGPAIRAPARRRIAPIRAREISAQGKTAIAGSSDPVFRGDATRWNPAELLIASLSPCHQLWYLHLCAEAGIVISAYSDDASGVEIEHADGAGQFERVTLRPHVKLAAGADESIARRLHDAAAEKCFIARSVSFRVEHEPTFEVAAVS